MSDAIGIDVHISTMQTAIESGTPRGANESQTCAMIIGTAGHVDHGKTALVKALTGVDTDRLAEEKRRGITIELGYAYTGELGFVDVPGHERFVHTMLAGASGIDTGLLVVDLTEGIRAQTREHVQILSLLGVRAGVVALTKSDLGAERIGEVSAALRTLLAQTPRSPGWKWCRSRRSPATASTPCARRLARNRPAAPCAGRVSTAVGRQSVYPDRGRPGGDRHAGRRTHRGRGPACCCRRLGSGYGCAGCMRRTAPRERP